MKNTVVLFLVIIGFTFGTLTMRYIYHQKYIQSFNSAKEQVKYSAELSKNYFGNDWYWHEGPAGLELLPGKQKPIKVDANIAAKAKGIFDDKTDYAFGPAILLCFIWIALVYLFEYLLKAKIKDEEDNFKFPFTESLILSWLCAGVLVIALTTINLDFGIWFAR